MAIGVVRTLIASVALALTCGCTIAAPPQPSFEIGVTVPTTHLDPARGDEPGTALVATLALETLPQLAMHARQGADGRAWSIELPRRVFVDGRLLDAPAVVANFARWSVRGAAVTPFTAYAEAFGSRAGARRIVAVKAIDATHLEILTRGRFDGLWKSLRDSHFAIGSPAAFANEAAYDRAPTGSGAYRVASFEPGAAVTLVPSATYVAPAAMRTADAPYASVVILDVPDPHTAILSLEKGDLSAVYGLPGRYLAEAYGEALHPLRDTSTGRWCAFAAGLVEAKRTCPPSASLVATHAETHSP